MDSVLILYHSQEYGNTRAMAQAVAQGAGQAGAKVQLVNTNEQRLDIEAYRTVAAVAFGSPDYYNYIAGGMKTFLDDWHLAKCKDPRSLEGKVYGLFYSHGGCGKVREPMEDLFKRMGNKVGQTIESNGQPNDEVMEACRGLGRQLAETVG